MPQATGYEKAVIKSYDQTNGVVFSNAVLAVPFTPEFKVGERVDFVWFDLGQAAGRPAVYALNLDEYGEDIDKCAGREIEMTVKVGQPCPSPFKLGKNSFTPDSAKWLQNNTGF